MAVLRADQAQADELLGTAVGQVHLMRGNFVWDLPDIRSTTGAMKGLFNAPNAGAITGFQNTMNLNSPQTPTAITNLPYDTSGNLIDSRSRPRGAGFGVANVFQAPRTIQLQLRFAF